MGRLQKKKPVKNKKSVNDSPESAGMNGGTSKKLAFPKKNLAAAKQVPKKKKENFIDKTLQFLREVKIELKKVTWPSRKQTVGSTIVVIIIVMIISFFLGLVDMGLSSLIRVVLQ